MGQWESLLQEARTQNLNDLRSRAEQHFDAYGVYASSIQNSGETFFFIAREEERKVLVLSGDDGLFDLFAGEYRPIRENAVKVCLLNHENCNAIRQVFPYVNPQVIGERRFSFGLGDRLGVATPGQLRAIKGWDVFPILAQQSMRELNLTKRTYVSVLDDACWGVFQERYTGGFGADADHLKTHDEVKYGLESGYTMVTLDCSEHIYNEYFDADEAELLKNYEQIPKAERVEIEREYLGTQFAIDNVTSIEIGKIDLMRLELAYGRAIEFMAHIFHDCIELCQREVDFEVSIDETTITTAPNAHFFIASQLNKKNVRVDSLAPRFYGEFQKGIDYIGDVGEFEAGFILHEKIARYFGYRLMLTMYLFIVLIRGIGFF